MISTKENIMNFCREQPVELTIVLKEYMGRDCWNVAVSFPEWFKFGVEEETFSAFLSWEIYVIVDENCDFQEWQEAVIRTVRSELSDFFHEQTNPENCWFLNEILAHLEENYQKIDWIWKINWIFAPLDVIGDKDFCNSPDACASCQLSENCGHFLQNKAR